MQEESHLDLIYQSAQKKNLKAQEQVDGKLTKRKKIQIKSKQLKEFIRQNTRSRNENLI